MAQSQVGWEVLRPRIYKAIRALVPETPDEESQRAALTAWLEKHRTEEFQGPTLPEELLAARQREMQQAWQRAVNRARVWAGEMFVWEEPPEIWGRELRLAVSELVRAEEAILAAGGEVSDKDIDTVSVRTQVLHLLRRRWCGTAEEPEACQVEAWLQEIGFFPCRFMEIGSWARFFHTLAKVYQEGRRSPEHRQQELAGLLAKLAEGQKLASIPEVVIYLEGRLAAEEKGVSFPETWPPPLDPEVFFPGQDVEAILQLSQEGLRFLRRPETEGEVDRRRLAWLAERRELIDLKDLLFLFLATVKEEEAELSPSEILDHLQAQGFPIRRREKGVDYGAWLAPLKSLAKAEQVVCRFPLEPGELSGNPALDLDLRPIRQEGRRQVWQNLREGALAFCQGQGDPMPRSGLIRAAARFVVGWVVMDKLEAGELPEAEKVSHEALELLPRPMLRLVRPRKGYELKHKGELGRLLHHQALIYQEAWSRWLKSGSVANLFDDGLLFYLAGVLALRRRQPELAALSPPEVQALAMEEVEEALKQLSGRHHLEVQWSAFPWWQEFRRWLKEKVDWPAILAVGGDGGPRAAQWRETAEGLFQEMAGQLYRLVVARARKERGLLPLAGDKNLLYWLAAWLTPALVPLKAQVKRQLLAACEERARRRVAEAWGLRVESREELRALAKYYLRQELKDLSLADYARDRKVSGLLAEVARRLDRVELPPEVRPEGGTRALVLELLRPRGPEADERERELVETILAHLPRSDCGSCGVPGCLAFARLLAQGRLPVTQCLQATAQNRQILEKILARQGGVALPTEAYVLTAEEENLLARLLDPEYQACRALLWQALREPRGQALVALPPGEVSILQIGKSPDAEAFHNYLVDYLGEEGAERLRAADLAFLTAYGDQRLAAEEQELDDSYSWMAQEVRQEWSVFALAARDPENQARRYYQRCIFLEDLSAADQEKVKEFRLRQYLWDFLEQWERGLPEHWQAGYRIEDWEDFAQLAAKSYWHQEHTPAPGLIWRELPSDLRENWEARLLAEGFLDNLVREQVQILEDCRQRLEMLLGQKEIETLKDLDLVARGLVIRVWQERFRGTKVTKALGEERVNFLVREGFEHFKRSNLRIPPSLRLWGDDIPVRVQELMAASPEISPEELARLLHGREGLTWREMGGARAGWLKAVMQAMAEQLVREEAEVNLFRQGKLSRPTLGTLRAAVRHEYWRGQRQLPDLVENLSLWLEQAPEGRQALGQAALRDIFWERLSKLAFLKTEPEAGPLIKALDQALRARFTHDLVKLKGYLFLLARLEGNLDKLTALLREIRETSDIIEAAWLSFTQERMGPSLGVSGSPSPGASLPLLATGLPDKERFNRYLRDGLPRGESQEYTQAYREFITLLQFYVVTAGPEEAAADLLGRLTSDSYDLSGLNREDVLKALNRELTRRQQLLDRKISICTQVLAQRLACQQPRWHASVAAFWQTKGSFFREERGIAEQQKGQVAANRGVELGKVKNELYQKIADFLREERTASFARRLEQILARLEEERQETLAAFRRGELNRWTAFYILRQYQKDQTRVTATDLGRFLRRHQPEALARLGEELAPEAAAAVARHWREVMAEYEKVLDA